jgi:hypothetical protein
VLHTIPGPPARTAPDRAVAQMCLPCPGILERCAHVPRLAWVSRACGAVTVSDHDEHRADNLRGLWFMTPTLRPDRCPHAGLQAELSPGAYHHGYGCLRPSACAHGSCNSPDVKCLGGRIEPRLPTPKAVASCTRIIAGYLPAMPACVPVPLHAETLRVGTQPGEVTIPHPVESDPDAIAAAACDRAIPTRQRVVPARPVHRLCPETARDVETARLDMAPIYLSLIGTREPGGC